MLDALRNRKDPDLDPARLAASNAIDMPTAILGNRHAIAMRAVSRRFWGLFALLAGAWFAGHVIAAALLNEPLLVALGIGP